MEAVVQAADKLSKKMERVQRSREYMAVWILAHNHGMPYTGEQWGDELDALDASIRQYQERKE
jgi:hypothetical protein